MNKQMFFIVYSCIYAMDAVAIGIDLNDAPEIARKALLNSRKAVDNILNMTLDEQPESSQSLLGSITNGIIADSKKAGISNLDIYLGLALTVSVCYKSLKKLKKPQSKYTAQFNELKNVHHPLRFAFTAETEKIAAELIDAFRKVIEI